MKYRDHLKRMKKSKYQQTSILRKTLKLTSQKKQGDSKKYRNIFAVYGQKILRSMKCIMGLSLGLDL
jgi:hypothetical protein